MTRLTDMEIGEIRKARARAEVTSPSTAWGEAITFFTSGIADPLRRLRERTRTVSELRALDDRMLADIGVRRSEIERIADTSAAAKHPGQSLWARLFAAYKAGHARRATIRALSRLPDSMLADIGITRTQIGDLATALMDATERDQAKPASTADHPVFVASDGVTGTAAAAPKSAADFGYVAENAEPSQVPANEIAGAQRAA